MYKVIVNAFGGTEALEVLTTPDPTPAPNSNEVIVRLTSIGMNHADLMGRRGEYRLLTGNPPFILGMEGGGYVEAIGDQVQDRVVGQRVLLSLDAPRSCPGGTQGTYQSHFVTTADQTILAPDQITDMHLGALWMPYLTAWGCLIWQQKLEPGQVVLLPAASGSVAIAASQIVKHHGGIAIGTTRSQQKLEKLKAMPEAQYDHILVTEDPKWWKMLRKLTHAKGPNIIFDPIAAGDFLNREIYELAMGGTLWIYGLFGAPDVVDVTPLIRKQASLRGWLINKLLDNPQILQKAYQHILQAYAEGIYQLPITQTFTLNQVKKAHEFMETGQHIGKLILIPGD